jgi:hypothetical protein
MMRKKMIRRVRKMEIERILKKISMLMDDIEEMIYSAEPETVNDLLYIYNEIEEIYNMLRMIKM